MKMFKKLAGLLLAMIMVFSMSTVAFAAQGTNDNSGSITINDAVEGHTYNAYQILVLESYNTTGDGAYSYKANGDWKGWLENQKQYVSIDAQGYVTWVGGTNAENVAAFAKEALAHAKEANINPVKTATADSTTVEFTGLNLGYYLIDTTLGTLCSLDTTTPGVVMYEKNKQPPVKKEVKEDSTGNWGDENTAEIGDTVEFHTTIGARPGAEKYILHDVMTAGLTLDPDSIEIDGLTKGQDEKNGDYHVVTTGLADECTFEVVFHQSYLDTITEEKNIVVTYNAVVNENAVIFDDANNNKTKLEFGEENNYETTWDETKTYTFKVDVVKTDSDNKVLDGAQFKLYDTKTGGNEIALVQVSDGVYRLAKDDETGVNYITTVNGQLEIKGFDANTNYYLEETKAPDGYNKLAERVEIAVKETNLEASVSNGIWTSGGVHIENKTGSLIPSTGGMGTTIFYIIGGVLVAAAGIFFVIRRRVSAGK